MIETDTSNSTKLTTEDLDDLRNHAVTTFVPVICSFYDKKKKKRFEWITTILARPENNHRLARTIDEFKNLKIDTPRQKIHCFLALSDFVIADDHTPSGEILELEYCRNIGSITAILRKKGKKSSWMAMDFEVHSEDFKSFFYEKEEFKEIEKIIEKEILPWVKKRREKRIKNFKAIEEKCSKENQ